MKNIDNPFGKMEPKLPDEVTKTTPPSKARILKNLFVVCVGFLFLFSAYQGLANLQSTLNLQDDLGVVSQSVIYAALIFSSLFLPKLVIKKFGCKWTLVISILTYAPYIAANFYPHMGTFVPTAILVGIGAAPLWSAKCTYINEISALYGTSVGESADVVTSRFFGIFFMVFQNTQIWGNLISFYVLKPSAENETVAEKNFTLYNSFLQESTRNPSVWTRTDFQQFVSYSDVFQTNTSVSDYQNETICGVHFCSGINENLKEPPLEKRYMLTGIYFGSILLASLIVAIFLDSLDRKSSPSDSSEKVLSRVVATLRHLKNADQMLLVPLTVFSGIEQAFILGDYTKAYVACAWGIHRVGLVFICFGVVNAVMSLVAGRLVKYVSRLTLMLTGATGNVVVCVVLFLWQPNAEQFVIFFVIIGVWGLSDAVWQTQINALYGVLFRQEAEAAFANYRLWESLGFFLAFGYSSLLCIDAKIYILLAFLASGMLGYIAVEVRASLRKRTYDLDVVPASENHAQHSQSYALHSSKDFYDSNGKTTVNGLRN